jgi:hypothetical protein
VWLAYPEAASSSIRQLAAIIIIDKRHSARHDMDRRRRTEGKGRKSDDTKKKWKDTEHGGDVGRCEKKSIETQKRRKEVERERCTSQIKADTHTQSPR